MYDDSKKWSQPVPPMDGSESPMSAAIRNLGLAVVQYGKPGSIIGVALPGDDVGRAFCWVPRWPDCNGEYGYGTVPQYCVRNDYGRYTLERVVEMVAAATSYYWPIRIANETRA